MLFKIATTVVDFIAVNLLQHRYSYRVAKWDWTEDFNDEDGEDENDLEAENYIPGMTTSRPSSLLKWGNCVSYGDPPHVALCMTSVASRYQGSDGYPGVKIAGCWGGPDNAHFS